MQFNREGVLGGAATIRMISRLKHARISSVPRANVRIKRLAPRERLFVFEPTQKLYFNRFLYAYGHREVCNMLYSISGRDRQRRVVSYALVLIRDTQTNQLDTNYLCKSVSRNEYGIDWANNEEKNNKNKQTRFFCLTGLRVPQETITKHLIPFREQQ